MRVRITSCTSKYIWYKDKIGEEFDVVEIDDNTFTNWGNINRSDEIKNPVLTYLTIITESKSKSSLTFSSLWRISPQDCIDVKIIKRDELISQLI